MQYQRASDAELLEAGWDPKWIAARDPEEGPYFAVHVFGLSCSCCGGSTDGWTVLNVETATGIGRDWLGDEAECEAEEHASALNGAWRAGSTHRSATIETA